MVICVKIKKIAKLAMLLTVAMLTGCTDEVTSSDDSHGTGGRQSLMLTVSEEPWENDSMTVSTRSNETMLNSLKESSAGIGIYSPELSLDNRQVTFSNSKNAWAIEPAVFWPQTINTANIYAYAPYDANTSFTDTKIHYTMNVSAPVDLLWANAVATKTTGGGDLHFQHALAKLSFTVTNNTGSTLTTNHIKIAGNLYSNDTFDLNNETWTNTGQTISISDYECYNNVPLYFIPGPTIEATIDFNVGSYGPYTAKFPVTPTQGKHTIVNFTVGFNHEVVIKD